MIKISIDLKQIDQSKCKKITRRDGSPATFLDLVLFETPNGNYGDYMVKQDTSKEDREAGVKMPILGNGKIIGRAAPRANSLTPSSPDDEECPF